MNLAKAWGHIIIAVIVTGAVAPLIAIGSVSSSIGVPVIVGIASVAMGLHPVSSLTSLVAPKSQTG